MSTRTIKNGIPPKKMILRCYARKDSRGKWYAVCLELNLAVEADSLKETRRRMGSVITSYLETVLDTKDRDSIPELLFRPAPIRDWAYYYYLRSLNFISKELPGKMLFKELIPFHLAHSC